MDTIASERIDHRLLTHPSFSRNSSSFRFRAPFFAVNQPHTTMSMVMSGKPLARGSSVRVASRQRVVSVRAAYERVPADKVKMLLDDKVRQGTLIYIRKISRISSSEQLSMEKLPVWVQYTTKNETPKLFLRANLNSLFRRATSSWTSARPRRTPRAPARPG